MKVIASSLRKGNIVEIDGKLGVIVTAENIHPGKGTPVTQMDVRRISDGVKVSLRFKTTDQVERAFVEDRKHQFMYHDGEGFHFMNMESYDQVTLQDDIIGDQAAYLQPEMEVTIAMYEGVPVSIELPPKAVLEVVETEPTHQEPDRGLVLQAGGALERRAHHGAALRHHRHQDRGDDRRRQLRRAGEGLRVPHPLPSTLSEHPFIAGALTLNRLHGRYAAQSCPNARARSWQDAR